MRPLAAALALAAAALAAAPCAAEGAGGIAVRGAFAHPTPPGAPVAGAYATLANAGAADDLLIGVEVDPAVAGLAQIHEMRAEDGVMRMAEVEGGVPIPAGGAAVLAPGGLHVMLMDLAAPFAPGDRIEAVLVFRDAGAVPVAFEVIARGEVPADASETGTHSGH